jgi:pyridoxal phosphate enzyme (YggS family)
MIISSIAENLAQVREQINSSAHKNDRSGSEICLLAVSKTRPADDLRAAYAEGQRDFGENYLQDAMEKIEALHDLDICWHFIGPMQSNKTRSVAEHFNWVHTVDRIKIAKRLSEQRPDGMPPLNICLQVNISEEESKSGCSPEEVAELASEIIKLPNLKLRGLMAIPQATNDPLEQQQAFSRLRDLQEQLKSKEPTLDTLSMGMSADMEAAIAEGATIVRIGTAIFGPRVPKKN